MAAGAANSLKEVTKQLRCDACHDHYKVIYLDLQTTIATIKIGPRDLKLRVLASLRNLLSIFLNTPVQRSVKSLYVVARSLFLPLLICSA